MAHTHTHTRAAVRANTICRLVVAISRPAVLITSFRLGRKEEEEGGREKKIEQRPKSEKEGGAIRNPTTVLSV